VEVGPGIAEFFAQLDRGVVTGDPSTPARAVAIPAGWAWNGSSQASVVHSVLDVETRQSYRPEASRVARRLFRDSLPFPMFTWKIGSWEVTHMVFPARGGFVARYHVMNHGESPATGLLRLHRGEIESPGRPAVFSLEPLSSRATPESLAYDLVIEPGASRFVDVATFDLSGQSPQALLEEIAAKWEKLLGPAKLRLPDLEVVTLYYADLAAQILGVEGRGAEAARIRDRFARRAGDSLELLGDIPEAWWSESLEIENLPTDFGALTLRMNGGPRLSEIEIGESCRPPGGFVLTAPERSGAAADGRPARVENRRLAVPSGTRRIEITRGE
jgi:hypothetical protein